MNIRPANPVLPMVKEIRETRKIEEVAAYLTSGNWVAIAATIGGDGVCLFTLGRVNPCHSHGNSVSTDGV